MAKHLEIGKMGEDLAAKYLEGLGFTIFDRNYNYKKTELDIVALIDNELHVVEVKTRSNTKSDFFKPETAVTEEKKENIFKAASFYTWERQLVSVPVVFDVIAVGLDDPKNPEIVLFEDAFRPKTSFF